MKAAMKRRRNIVHGKGGVKGKRLHRYMKHERAAAKWKARFKSIPWRARIAEMIRDYWKDPNAIRSIRFPVMVEELEQIYAARAQQNQP
jgi:hypothetical protein